MSQERPHEENFVLPEGDEEEFIDFNDPENEVLVDENDKPGDVGVFAEEEDDDGSDMERIDDGGAEVEDLNDMPDREPAREDAVAIFHSPGNQPLHVVRFHPQDTSLLAAAGEGETAFVLRLCSTSPTPLSLVVALEGHNDTINLLEFSPDAKWLATASLNGHVRLWKTEDWSLYAEFTDLVGELEALLWHPSSLVLCAAGAEAQVALWNVAKAQLMQYLVGHMDAITAMQWLPGAKLLMTGGRDGSVLITSPKTAVVEATIAKGISPDNAPVVKLTLYPNPNVDQCFVGCEDGTIHVLSTKSNKIVAHFEEVHQQAIEGLCVNESGTMLASCSCDCKIVVWNLADHSVRTIYEVGESVIPLCWLHDAYLVAGCSDGEVKIWDGRSSTQEPLASLCGHRRMVLDVAVLPQHGILATAADDGSIRVFQLPVH